MEKQLLGNEAPLKKGPGTMNFDGRTGQPLEQLLGNEAPIKETPYSLMPINAETKHGTRQAMGSEAPLIKTPYHGWCSHDTPMSERDIKQSK
jgi:hypothetical protein